FYGPPGTGKTHVAGLLAQHLATAAPGDGLVELVQFHPAYAYEDFVQGIRPVVEAGQLRYEMQNGRLLDFCQRAAARAGTSVLIVDELNRANVAAVFGELLLLLEYRDRSIPLAGGGRFALPANVRLLGTMNTADRAIALVDHALRRRFAFIPLWPNPAVLRHYHAQHATGYDLAPLLDLLADLNAQLEPHYQVGHTFFMQPDLAAQLPDIWRMEIEPYLEEYFYNQPERVAPFRWEAVEPRLSGQKWDADKHG
ncbi:MAG: AAA family ATPase, partial [Caldilineaceae bacterium]|nr:AAA family ATPase [Caldilineaceae bacterium]